MKTLIIALALSVSATSVRATDWGDFTVKVSLAQTIAVVVNQTLYASSNFTSNRKAVAKQIQNDVQDYNQTGEVSVFLADKIAMVQAANADMSEQDSVDVLLLASDLLLK